MGVVGQKRLHGLRSASIKDDFRIQVVLGKEPQLGKRLQGSLKTGDAAVCNDDVFVGPCRTAQQKQNNGNDSKNAAEKSIPHGGACSGQDIECDFHNHDLLSSFRKCSQTLMACECRVDTP